MRTATRDRSRRANPVLAQDRLCLERDDGQLLTHRAMPAQMANHGTRSVPYLLVAAARSKDWEDRKNTAPLVADFLWPVA